MAQIAYDASSPTMSERSLGWLSLVALCAGCAQPAQPKVAVAEPPVVVDVSGSGEGEGDPGESHPLEPEDDARKSALEQARNAGILGILQASKPGESVFGTSGLGDDAETALGGLTGETIGEAYGAGGLGLRGTGRGGGGSAEGIGLGSVGIIGRGSGGGGAGFGSGTGRIGGGKQGSPPRVTPARPMVRGRLDKEIIRRIIRRHLAPVRYCYERQLAKDPNLEGRLTIEFTIGKDGRVTAARVQEALETTVDSCVVRTFRRMMFPKPQGGGTVVVSYPFVFKAGSSPPAPPSKPPQPSAPARPVPAGPTK